MAGNLTRINNNQITDAVSGNTQFGINANTKIQPYSITSTLLANNLTYGSDLTVSGNLSVTGNVTAIDTTNTTIEDPLLLLASTQTGSPTVDIGYIGQRGTANNIAFVWDESEQSFVTVFTSSGAGDNTNIAILSYADLKTANANVTGNLVAGNLSLSGNVTSTLNVTGNIVANNISVINEISATGNIVTGDYFVGDGYYISNINASNVSSTKISNGTSSANIGAPDGNLTITINNNENSIFYDNGLSVIGNINTGNSVNAGNLSLSGNVIGNLNLDGNIIPSANAVYSLGNATSVWKDLYLSPNTLYVGPVQVGANSTSNVLTVNNNIVVTYTNGNADISASGNVSATGNLVTASGAVNTANLSLSGNVISDLNVTLNATAGNVNAVANVSAGGNVVAYDTVNSNQLSLSGNVISALNVTLDATAQNLYATTTVSSAGNVNAFDTLNANQLSLSGNVIANLNATFNVNANNVTTTNYVSATGNVYGANFATTGPQGNITGANVVSAITFTATGNVYASSIDASANISATGNISTQQTFVGNALRGDTLIITSTANGLLLSITGNINAANTYINNVPTPIEPLDAVNKQYVDDVVQGLNIHDSTIAATPNTLAVISGGTVSYNNGNAGVGANLVTTGTYTNIDGVAINTVGTRILVKDEVDPAWNGIYTYSNSTVLIRATDYNTVPEVEAGDFVLNLQGNTYANTGWVQVSNTQVIGTDPIVFTQFSGAQTLTGGNAIAINGTVINALYDGNTVGVNGSNQLYIPANAPLTTPNIGSATGSNLSVTGSVIGNIFQANTISVTGNAFLGNISTGNISLTGNVLTNLNVTADITANNVYAVNNFSAGGNVYGGIISASGNVTAANFATSGSGGNITGANVISATTFTATGNVYGNVAVFANVSATGNVGAGQYLFGDGGYISNINAANVSSTKISNGGSYANIASSNSNLVIAIGSSSNVAATFYDTGVDFGGNISVNGNVTGANFVGNLSGGLGSDLNVNNYVIKGGNYNGITLAMPIGFGANLASVQEGGVTLAAGTSGTTAGTLLLDSTGNVSASGNVYATGNISTGDYFVGDGYYISNINAANVSTTKISNGNSQANIGSANGNLEITINGNAVATFYDTGLSTVGNITTSGNVSATANVIGGNILTAGYVSSTGNIQSGTTMLVDVTTGTVTLGANITQTVGATLAINATDSMLLPVGNVGQRPATPATGMLRYNSTVSQCEIWNGAAWVAVGGSSYTVISNEQFNGDGTTVQFTLGSSQTTNSCIVTINGVVQIPTTAYSVSGTFPTCYLTFTEAPEIGDTIDVREITTTTTVTAISNSPGNAIVSVSQTVGEVDITGNLVAQLNPAAPSLTANSTMSFQLINNTTLAILVRGTDGTTRSANITLS